MTMREVLLEGGAPWGFRMHGGVDQNQPLRISRVNPDSKAAHRGIREGDLISSINGQSTKSLSNTEAHGLLRNSGDVLKLGLNEDPDGSPKRRQYRTVHHLESFQETVKRSSITTYSSVKTVEDIDSPSSDKDNEHFKVRNGQTSINGTSTVIPPSNLLLTKKPSSSSSSSPTLTKEDLKTLSSDNALASQRSSYTNCTLSPSSPSILSEDGTCSCTPTPQISEDKHNSIKDNMNDSKSNSKSKRRRQRRKNRKIESNTNDDSTRDNTDKAFPDEYTVQSPIELSKESINKKPTKPVKSRSLDDDEMFKIQEVSDNTETEDKDKETHAIVSEASESEVDWEETETLDTPPPIHGSLSTLTLPLEGCITEQITLMSPEEEKSLRDFLEGLNLVNGPEEAANQIPDKSETLKEKKAMKKAELEKYFFPMYQNPRYLDVISEESRESSDRESDRESKTSITRVLRKGTPETPNTPPKVPPRPNRRKILHKSAPPIEQPKAVLVDTKMIEPIQPVCTTVSTSEEATASNVEIVYLTDSGEELESNSSDSYAVLSEKDSSNEDLSEETLINLNKTDDETVNVSNAQQLTNTLKYDKISNESFEEIIKPNETETTMISSTTNFSVKSNEDINSNVDMYQLLTPPPTPDNCSPNDTKGSLTADLVSFMKVIPEIYTNVLTPPPPSRSPSSSRSSSRSSSLCTAKYNPSTSSITDVLALMKEPEEGKYFQPLTLREICLQFLLSLPFGKDILEELADVAKYIESYTSSLPSTVLPKLKLVPNIAQFADTSRTISNNISYDISVKSPNKKRQEDITCDKVVPNVGLDDTSGFQQGNVTVTVVKDVADTGDDVRTIEHRIPIEVCTEYKPKGEVNDLEEEISIPIQIEEEIYDSKVIKIESVPKEVAISAREDSLNQKPREYVIPIRQEKKIDDKIVETTKTTTIIDDKGKEVIIPIRKDSLNAKIKEYIIPIKKEVKTNETYVETKKNCLKIIDEKGKEVVIPIRKDSLKANNKEYIIPIKKEVKTNEKHVEINKSSTRIGEKENEVVIPVRKDSLNSKVKECIIPIEKEETVKIKVIEDKGKEVIIPVRVESLKTKDIIINTNKETAETTKHSTRIEDKRQEVIIPIRKESLNIKTKECIIPIKQEHSAGHTGCAKELLIPISKEIGAKCEEELIAQKEIIIPVEKEELADDKESNKMKHREVNSSIMKEWSGIPTERDPQLLLCLSPKQKDELEKKKQIPDEAAKLLDLHEKFINRKTCNEEIKKEIEETVTVINSNQKPCNRLLTIIKEEPTGAIDDKNYLYFVEKDTKRYEKTTTLPRSTDTARLHAKDLSEWLNLARNKSMSESNLTTAADIPENNLRNNFNVQHTPPIRRTSLPQDIFEKQMIYIQEKEREIQRQLEALEEEKRLLNAEMAPSKEFQAEDYYYSRKGDFAESKKRPTSMPLMPTEYFRQQMYEEYMDKFAEREDRKQHKIIKVTSSKDLNQESASVDKKEILHPIQLEDEFMDKVKELQNVGKLEKMVKSIEKDVDGGDEDADEPPVLVMDGEELKVAKELPKHLQEFVDDDGIWSPGQKIDLSPKDREKRGYDIQQDDSLPPVWTPKSANSSPVSERKEFRSVNFQSPVLSRRNRTTSENLSSQPQLQTPPWKIPDYNSDTGSASSFLDRKLPTSRSTPATGFSDFSSASRLPKAQNPTITLLQKAREGQLPKGALYIDQEQKQYRPRDDRPPIAGPGEVLYQIKNEYTSESDNERPRKMTDLGPRKFEGIGPVTKEGIPLVLRSEVKDQNQSKWYKKMYDTIHKQKPHNDEYVTVRYKQKRAQYPYTSGYLSEPEPGAYDSDFTDYKYQTLDRRRPPPQDRPTEYVSSTMPRPTVNRSSSSDIVRNTQDYYRSPGKIENYIPGHSSIAEKEAKQWWDEVMDIFDGHLEQQKKVQPQVHPRSFINQCLKDTGYESDSTLVFRRREEAAQQQLSPKEQREAYKVIQKGGDVPLHGLRKLAPEKPKEPEPPVPPPKGQYARNLNQESPRKYVENDVTIHYKTPVRQEIKDYLSEDELAHRQAETMKKIYQEERRKKYLQELQDMNSRRHTDNFIPSQKSPISLNRYDDFDDLAPNVRPRPRSPEHRLCARALYNFVGQSARELTFRKGDIIYLRRQIDKNWYEGELNAMVGLFPANYVEIIPFEGTKTKSTLRKAHEGQARAKYNFVAQTHLELSLAKGELVVVTRKIDDNWFEGKIGGRKGIFPANYVDILIDPQSPPPPSSKPVAAPASHSLLLNGSSGGKESMGSHSYRPSLPSAAQLTSSSYHAKPVHVLNTGSYNGKIPGLSQALHIETHSEPVPYRAMYKYKPQNEDELELLEGDTVFVLEKCDDGWYVGSSERTGAFGTFPGNYVEKI